MRYAQWRLIGAALGLIVYLFIMFPIPAIVISVVLIIGYVCLTRANTRNTIEYGQELRRREALRTAKIYLSPYKDIWKNLKLSNKYCSLKLGVDGLTITAAEKSTGGRAYRTFRVIESRVHAMQDLWDMFCISFSHNTTYDGLVNDCKLYQVVVEERIIGDPKTLNIQTVQQKSIPAKKPLKPVEKTDINNASEVELTALPGISIVMAKKIIKKREEIGGFKNINDFFLFLKLKPHMKEQLKFLVCVNKMKGSLNIERYKERSVDL